MNVSPVLRLIICFRSFPPLAILPSNLLNLRLRRLKPAKLLCFSRDHIESLSFRYPLFASYYQNIMLTIIYKLDVLLAVRLSSTAEEFIQFLYTNYAWMINRVPDKYIAHYMGISNAWYCKLKRKVLSFTRTE